MNIMQKHTLITELQRQREILRKEINRMEEHYRHLMKLSDQLLLTINTLENDNGNDE